jgi:glycosyltransferase involved in cell wall biosynthesis
LTSGRPTICQVLHGLGVGGAEVLAARLARRLADAYRFVFVCLDELGVLGERLRDEGFPTSVIDRGPGFDWRCSRRLAEVLRNERVELVHAHQYAPFFYSALARLASRHPPILFTEHGRQHPDVPRPKRVLANSLLLRKYDHAVGVGDAVRRALIDNERLSPDRVSVIYNGIDLGPYRGASSPEERVAIRRELGIRPQVLTVVQVARLDALKDHETAIRALARLVQTRTEVKLVLVGEGPEEAAIRRLVREHALEPFVLMLGLRGDVPRLLRAADLMLLSSVTEGIPLTLIEGMAAGLPAVATRVGGVGEVVEDGQTGLLSPAGDHAALAAAIARLAGDPDLRLSMGSRARNRAEAVFDEDRMLAEYRAAYERMLRVHAGTPEARR